jgi:[acyl-carrier-protein] S-malonyltransferase
MRPAAEKVAAALESIEITGLKVPVVTNVDAQPNRDPGRVKRLLVEQVTAPVRWEESVQRLAAEGVTRGLELGPGNVLAGLVKRTARQIGVAAVAEPADVEALCAAAAAQQAS